MTNEWFSGDAPRNQDETTFLEQLRQAAQDWDSLGVAPEDTLVWTALNPLYVQVEVPQLSHDPKDGISLQVGYWPAPASGLCLQGEWGDGHRLDNGGHAVTSRSGASYSPLRLPRRSQQSGSGSNWRVRSNGRNG